MRGLTLYQPWASLMAVGAKRIETRSWSTPYRGEVVIHAARHWPKWEREAFDYELDRACQGESTDPKAIRLVAAGIKRVADLPLGQIVAVGRLDAIYLTGTRALHDAILASGPDERALGDYSPDRYGWVFSDVVRLPRPILAWGERQLWLPPTEIVEAIRQQLTEVRGG